MSASLVGSEMCIRDRAATCCLGSSASSPGLVRRRLPRVARGRHTAKGGSCLLYTSDAADDM
eukprot:12941763-Alexandrium_andersonii.AAC.1